MDFDITVARSLKELDADAWNSLGAGRPFSSYRWHLFGETVLQDFPPRYVLLSREGEPVARAVFWLKHREWLPGMNALARAGVEALLQKWPLFACATPLISLPGLILPEDSLRQAALSAISNTALELARQERASFALFSYTSPKTAPLWPAGFRPVSYADEETSLQVRWPDFDTYLAGLAHSTRRNYKLHGRKAVEMGLEVSISRTPPQPSEVLPLIFNVDSFHHVGHRPWTRALVDHLDLIDSAWVTVRQGGRLLGCCAVIGDEGSAIATLLGLDYSIPNYLYVYYQVIYAAIRCAIESGAHLLYGGGGAYELKRRLGFTTLPDDCMLVAPVQPFFSLVLKSAGRFVQAPVPAIGSEPL